MRSPFYGTRASEERQKSSHYKMRKQRSIMQCLGDNRGHFYVRLKQAKVAPPVVKSTPARPPRWLSGISNISNLCVQAACMVCESHLWLAALSSTSISDHRVCRNSCTANFCARFLSQSSHFQELFQHYLRGFIKITFLLAELLYHCNRFKILCYFS
jgi:hypothetical protein